VSALDVSAQRCQCCPSSRPSLRDLARRVWLRAGGAGPEAPWQPPSLEVKSFVGVTYSPQAA
jgi:hypothetical protein